MLILIFLVILVLGLAVMVAMLMRRISSMRGDASADDADLRARRYEESTRMMLEETRRQYERQISDLEQRLDAREADMERRLDARSSELRKQSALEFASLAGEALRRESGHLQDANRSNIDDILSPLRERIEDFRRAVNDSYVKDNASRHALSEQIATLARANADIGEEARRLSNALRGDTSMQGRWGETVLERLLEQSGMIAGVHFISQTSTIDGADLKSDDGRALRPDMVILLPGDHRIVVDAKTSMTDYIDYCGADSPKEAEICLRRHAASVRKHVKELADKQYHRHIKGALEHSLMFMPNDASYLAAIRGDASLCDYALRSNVAIVAPAHMLSVVQLISQLWRVENQNRNAEEIAKAGGLLYDKVAAFLDEFSKVQKYIRLTQGAYDGALRHLSAGNSSVAARAERLREMGAKATRRIPPQMLEGVADGESRDNTAEPSACEPRSGEE